MKIQLRKADSLPTKANGRPNFQFRGDNTGEWEIGKIELGALKIWDWVGDSGMSSQFDWKNLMVDNATEHNRGFLKALTAAVKKYPELKNYMIKFDGPWIAATKLLGLKEETFDWSKIKFLHGTATYYWEAIQKEGLRPRSTTNVKPSYGTSSSAKEGRKDAVYLTTQKQMANAAARDAARNTKSNPIILLVSGIDGKKVIADEDSKQPDPRVSLESLGSIGYLGAIAPSKIKVLK